MAPMKRIITRAAIELFFKKGYYATSISEIARACNIQKASIYYHFSSKEALLFSIMQDTMAALTVYLRSNLEKITGIEQRMRKAVSCHVHFHLEHQKETFIASSELRGLSPENYRLIVAMRDEYETIFQELIAAGTRHQVFAPCDVKILSYAILTLCTAGAFWFNPRGRLKIPEIAVIYETFIISGLKQGRVETLPPGYRPHAGKGGSRGFQPKQGTRDDPQGGAPVRRAGNRPTGPGTGRKGRIFT